MKVLITSLAVALACSAQVTQMPSSATFGQTRTYLNNGLTYLDAGKQPVITGAPSAWPSLPVFVLSSVCDGVTDSRAAIQAILTANAGKAIVLPAGATCLITPVADKSKFLSLPAGTLLSGAATLKVANGSGPYGSVINAVDCSACVLRDFTIDANVAGNPIANLAETVSNPRYEITFASGTNMRISGVTIKNSSATNSIIIAGTGVTIENCNFVNMGNDPNAVVHDVSTIYTNANEVLISGNYFQASSLGAPGATTAIEVHGSDIAALGNRVKDYITFANLTGIYTSDSQNITFAGNTGTGLLNGIDLASNAYGAHTTGYGLNGVTITGNSFRFNQLSYVGTTVWGSNSATSGIFMDPTASLPWRNVNIADNTLVWDLDTGAPANSTSIGIGFWSVTGTAASASSGVSITNNTLENCPVAGIRAAAVIQDWKISGNTIRNAGSSTDSGVSAGYKYPINIYAQPATGLEIKNNLIVDNLPTSRMTQGMRLAASAASTGVVVMDNTVRATGATTTSFTGPWTMADNFLVPFIRDVIPGFVAPSYSVAAGSTVIDSTNGKSYMLPATGTGWLSSQIGIPYLMGTVNQTGLSANLGATTIKVIPAGMGGMYRISCYTVVTQAATTSSTLPNCYVAWGDWDTNASKSLPLTAAPTTNTVGTNGLQAAVYNGVATIAIPAGNTVAVSASTYASSGATPMQYALHAKLEYLGN